MESRWLACAAVLFVALYLLDACGQNTPITLESSAAATLAPASTETPRAGARRPTLDILTVVPLPATPKGLPTLAAPSGATPTPTAIPRDAPLTLPDCTPPIDVPVDMPRTVPSDFPYPPGLKLFDSSPVKNSPNSVRIVGYVPMSLTESVRYVLVRLPEAGYTIGHGDSELGEAEAQFFSKGWFGGFRIRALRDCPTVTQWLLLFLKHDGSN